MKIAGYLLFIFWSLSTRPQALAISPLSIGDKMPDIAISNVSNYKSTTLLFSELKGKLVILDFWGINCSPCIKAFPKLETLQDKFTGQLQIICVNTASKFWIDSVAKKRQESNHKFRLSSLPSITSDSLLNKMFPHRIIPHYVWIDGNGTVAAITEEDELIEENIMRLIRNERISLLEKKDLMNLNLELPLFPQLYKEKLAAPKYYSMLSESINGLAGEMTWYHLDTLENTVRITRGNQTILDFYGEVLQKRLAGNPYEVADFDYGKRVILLVRDSSRYLFDSCSNEPYKRWRDKNSFCYEMVLPIDKFDELYPYYLADLNRYFGLEAKIEKRLVKCHSIVRTSKKDKIKFDKRSGVNASYVDSLGVYHLSGVGKGLYFFRSKLAETYKDSPYIFVDQTGYTEKINLRIESPLQNLSLLRAELKSKYDLDIVETEAELDMIILAEVKQKKTN